MLHVVLITLLVYAQLSASVILPMSARMQLQQAPLTTWSHSGSHSQRRASVLPEDQYEMDPFERYPENEEDARMIDAMRLERMVANDLWQSTSMRDGQGGSWTGDFEVLQPSAFNGPGDISLELVASGAIKTAMSSSAFAPEGVTVLVTEEVDIKDVRTSSLIGDGDAPRPRGEEALEAVRNAVHPRILQPSRSTVASTEWRLCRGNQVVGSCYTTASQYPEVEKAWDDAEYDATVPETYVAEVGAREGRVRTRVRYVYSKTRNVATADLADLAPFALHLSGVMVIRESLPGASEQELGLLRDPRLGLGIYDQQVVGGPYVVLNLPGRLSLCFPCGMQTQKECKNVLTMEWTAKNMRYQVDRKFGEFTGRIRSLELTEIAVQDADTYYPGLFSTVLE